MRQNRLKSSFKSAIKSYGFSIILLLSIFLGGLTGLWMGKSALTLKPFGDLFLNLMFTVVMPLVFFSVASSVASIDELRRFGRIITVMMGIFLFMGIIAAVYMLIVCAFFPPGSGFIAVKTLQGSIAETLPTDHHFLSLLTVSDFPQLLSRNNMLALIVFALLTGCAVSVSGDKGKPFLSLLQSGMTIFMKMTSFVMYYAPIGFFAYFAVLIGQLGAELMGSYFRIGAIYYIAALIYFIVAFTGYAWISRKKQGVKTFWKNILPPSITALATCSSAASIPVNLEAAENMKIDPEVYNTVIPLGTIIHKQGSILGGIVKISFLFTLFHLPFFNYHILLTAVAVALLVGTVMGAIPSGGMLGEMLIISVYGFPAETLMLIAVISLIIDPPATMLNVTGNTVGSLLIDRWVKRSKTS